MSRRVLSALLLAGAPLLAQQHPNVERGFQADKVYQVNGVDNINVFNGNLTLRIPLGAEYPGNGTLKYQFVLTYNSKAWDQQVWQYYTVEDCETHGDLPPANPNGWCNNDYIKIMPSRRSNAGMGWMLSLGRLLSPSDPIENPGLGPDSPGWAYESPDGADHRFSMADSGYRYTKDGSYLRLKTITLDAEYEVEFADGMVHTFKSDDGHAYYLDKIRDRFGNNLKITYAGNNWTLTEKDAGGNVVRQHAVIFQDSKDTNIWSTPTAGAPDNYRFVVKELDVAAFNSSEPARYRFGYTVDPSTGKNVADTVPYTCHGDYRSDTLTPTPKVPRLRKVTLPDNSSWTFDYGTSLCSSLNKMVYPTGGRIEWTYRQYDMPTAGCRSALVPDTDSTESAYSSVEGVETKKVFSDGSTTADGNWMYGQAASLSATVSCSTTNGGPTHGTALLTKYKKSTVTVTNPDGLKVENYFSIWDDSSVSNYFLQSEFGLPYTRDSGNGCNASPTGSEFCVTSREYDCNSSPCALKKTNYVRYDGESRTAENVPTDFEDFGYRREVARKTVFEDDGGKYIQTDRKKFDGLGHYRLVTTFDSWSGLSRDEYTNFNPGKSDVCVVPGTWQNCQVGSGSCACTTPINNRPTAGDPWLLNLYDSSSVGAYGTTFKSEYCFDSTGSSPTGFLQRRRTLASSSTLPNPSQTAIAATRQTKDLLVVSGHDSNGNMTTEQYYGGDGTAATLRTDQAICSLDLPSAAAFALNHAYDAGIRKSTQFSGVSFKTLNLTIDHNTGLPSASADTSELVTSFEYDPMGRLTKVAPPGQAFTKYTYGVTDPPPSLTIKQWANGNTSETGSPLTEKHYYYDGLGRPKQVRTQMPEGWSVSTTNYSPPGRPLTVSVPDPTTYRTGSAFETFTPSFTTTTQYDVYGRPTLVTAPDNSTTTLTYTGGRVLKRTRKINSPGSDVATMEEYDGLGQTRAVTENSDGTNPVKTTYGYDAGGHLACVGMSATDPCPSAPFGQDTHGRLFAYDGRGFLQSETHPENGTTSYTFDALGHTTGKTVGSGGTAFDLTFDFDAAGRPRHVKGYNPSTASFRDMKEFTYNDANITGSSPNYREGKLETASRYNYDAPAGATTVVIKETYFYSDSAGRMTERDTTISGMVGDPRTLYQYYTYDDLGQITNILYPFTSMASPSWLNLSPAYKNGLLTTLAVDQSQPSFTLNDITYSPNGAVHVIKHRLPGNSALTDTYMPDSHGMLRPKSIMFQGWTGGCDAPSFDSVLSSHPTPLLYGVDSTNLSLSSLIAHGENPVYQWYKVVGTQPTKVDGATLSSYTAAPTSTTTYWVRVANSCGYVDSSQITVSVKLNAPTALVAVRDANAPSNTPRINVTWTQGDNGASAYHVWRKSNGSWQDLTPSGIPASPTSYQDSYPVGTDAAYIYHVAAAGTNVIASDASANDVANPFVFQTVAPGMLINFADFDAILQHGINNLLSANGNATRSWQDIDHVTAGPGEPSTCTINVSNPDAANHSMIYGAHIQALRCAMNRALQSAGVPTTSYTDSVLTNVVIKALHITELQDSIK